MAEPDQQAAAASQRSATEVASQPNETSAPPIYRSFMLEVERRRRHLVISMERLSEIAGPADRSFAKYLHSGTPHGRTARWETIQIIVDTLWGPKGPQAHRDMHAAPNCAHCRESRPTCTARPDARVLEEAAAARQKIPAEERSAIASRAARARWHRPRLQELDPLTLQPLAAPGK